MRERRKLVPLSFGLGSFEAVTAGILRSSDGLGDGSQTHSSDGPNLPGRSMDNLPNESDGTKSASRSLPRPHAAWNWKELGLVARCTSSAAVSSCKIVS